MKNIIIGILALAVLLLVVFGLSKNNEQDSVLSEPHTEEEVMEIVSAPIVEVETQSNTLWNTIERDEYSFDAPHNWHQSFPNFEGCQWGGISNDSGDGMRMAGEISIYPVSCFDLSNANYQEVTELDGYYILAHYDAETGTSPAEILETQEAYQRVLSTFSIN